MKKVVRTVWISVLTGLAFLVVACTSQNRIPRKVRKQLMAERDSIEVRINDTKERADIYWNAPFMKDLNSYDNLNEKRDACMTLIEIKEEQIDLYNRLNEINTLLGKEEEAAKNDDASIKARSEIKLIEEIINNLVPPCLYGPPPTD